MLDLLYDGRNAVIAGLILLAMMLGTIVMIATLSSSPYARKDEVKSTVDELRTRVNLDLANQAVINHDVQAQINELKKERSK